MPRDQETVERGLSILRRLKLRLQFTGWLQYAPSIAIVIVLSLITRLMSFIGYNDTILFWIFAIFNILFFINLLIELITVKFKVRPHETKPSTNNSNRSIFRVMRLRRSCRSFQKQKLSKSDFNFIINLIKTQSHSSSRLGPNTLRFEYICAPLIVWPAVNTQEFIVAITPAQYNRQAVIDVGRCLQKIVLEATKLDIATCWIGPGASHESVIKHLGTARFDESKDHIICVCAVGYQSIYEPLLTRFVSCYNSSNRFGRLPLKQLLFHNDGGCIVPMKEEMLCMEPFARFAPCFEGCRWYPSSKNGQPTRCVVVTEEKKSKTN